MYKPASVIERLRDSLSPDIWNQDKKMYPEIRRQALTTAKEIAEDAGDGPLRGVYMLGSLTGYKYSDTSDIDIMVAIEGLKPGKSKTHGAKKYNGRIAKGTNRVISYFLAEWRKDTAENLASIDFGVYDVMEDEWLNEPPERKDMAPTYAKFWSEFLVADAKVRHFNKLVKDYLTEKRKLSSMVKNNPRESLFEYYKVERQKEKVRTLFQDALDFVESVDKDRKIAYSSDWGPGRNSKQNIIYKVLQYDENGEFFKDLLEYKSKRNLEEDASKSKRQGREPRESPTDIQE